MVNFIWAIAASIAVSLISLIAIFALFFNEKFLEKILFVLIGFSAGGLIGGAFLHILPEALEQSQGSNIFLYVIIGFIFFFVLERCFYWRHCHAGNCEIHPFTYLNLIGDGIHNFIDGLVIGSSFSIGIPFGSITTLMIIFHEIPQEIGDFGVLLYGGFNRMKAISYNFISALTCVVGTILGYPLSQNVKHFSVRLLPIIAGGFIYIAACDLIPEIHKQNSSRRVVFSIIAFICGIAVILLLHTLHF